MTRRPYDPWERDKNGAPTVLKPEVLVGMVLALLALAAVLSEVLRVVRP